MRSPRNPLQRAIATLFLAIALLSPVFAQSPPFEVNGIAAKVNGRVITKNKVGMLLTPEWKRLAARFPDRGPEYEKQIMEAKDTILKELIEREKTLSQPNQVPIPIAPKEIDDEIQREIRDNYEGSEEQFDAALRANRMTMDGYRKFAHDKLLAEAIRAREANKK